MSHIQYRSFTSESEGLCVCSKSCYFVSWLEVCESDVIGRTKRLLSICPFQCFDWIKKDKGERVVSLDFFSCTCSCSFKTRSYPTLSNVLFFVVVVFKYLMAIINLARFLVQKGTFQTQVSGFIQGSVYQFDWEQTMQLLRLRPLLTR